MQTGKTSTFPPRTSENEFHRHLFSDREVCLLNKDFPYYLDARIKHGPSVSNDVSSAVMDRMRMNRPDTIPREGGREASHCLDLSSMDPDVFMNETTRVCGPSLTTSSPRVSQNFPVSTSPPKLPSFQDSPAFPAQNNWQSPSTTSIPGATTSMLMENRSTIRPPPQDNAIGCSSPRDTSTAYYTGANNSSSITSNGPARSDVTAQRPHRACTASQHVPAAALSSNQYATSVVGPNSVRRPPEMPSLSQLLFPPPRNSLFPFHLYGYVSPSRPSVCRPVTRGRQSLPLIHNFFPIPTWAAWIEQDRNVPIEHGVTTTKQTPDPLSSRTSPSVTQASSASDSRPLDTRCHQSESKLPGQSGISIKPRSNSVVSSASSSNKHKREVDMPKVSPKDREVESHSHQCLSRREQVKRSGGIRSTRNAEDAQASRFVSDRIGDTGRCKFTLAGVDGSFKKICGSELIDNTASVRAHLTEHFEEHRLYELWEEQTKVMCPWCNVKRTQLAGLLRHISEVHLKMHLNVCPCGGKNCRSQQKQHVERHRRSDIHHSWAKRVEWQLKNIIGEFEVDMGHPDDFMTCESSGSESLKAVRRRRYSM